ncbi:thioredoxin-like protein, partial [Coprinopsis sp. MPI-PUGE-AT-0042]
LSTSKQPPTPEIYGLLHLLTASASSDTDKILVQHAESGDVNVPIPFDVYSDGKTLKETEWRKERKRIDAVHPVVVFSKTYCPYSRKAKQLLESYRIQPPPKVIEVDTREDGQIIKNLLTRLTAHSTFPNVIIQGRSIGGSDSLQSLHASGELEKLIKSTGATVQPI